jgi:hypothetical protein
MIINDDKAYNYRQIKLMKAKILFFKNKDIKLLDLINNLEGILSCIKNPPKKWHTEFVSWWSNLESVYANAAYECRIDLDSQNIQIIDEAVKNIEQIIEIYQKENFTEDDILKFEYIDQ